MVLSHLCLYSECMHSETALFQHVAPCIQDAGSRVLHLGSGILDPVSDIRYSGFGIQPPGAQGDPGSPLGALGGPMRPLEAAMAANLSGGVPRRYRPRLCVHYQTEGCGAQSQFLALAQGLFISSGPKFLNPGGTHDRLIAFLVPWSGIQGLQGPHVLPRKRL